MDKVFNFQSSLKKGKSGELKFFEKYANKLERLDGYIADFKILKNGKTIELKTDFYDADKTGNFFMERFSYTDKPGGPFQALDKKVHYYVYYFPKNDIVFCFSTRRLVNMLKKMEKDLKKIEIRNTSHITVGYVVARSALKKLMINIKEIL